MWPITQPTPVFFESAALHEQHHHLVGHLHHVRERHQTILLVHERYSALGAVVETNGDDKFKQQDKIRA